MSRQQDDRPRLSYRLNPYYFLSDRKVWVAVAVLLLSLCLGLAVHYMSLATATLATSRWGYLLAFFLLAICPVLTVHLLAPLLARRGRSRLIARLPRNSLEWDFHVAENAREVTKRAPVLAGQARPILQALGFESDDGRSKELLALLGALAETTDQVRRHAAEVSGRDPGDVRHPTISIHATDQVCSPYCHARLLGTVHIVVPLGAPMDGESIEETTRCLLAHELAHVLLRDAPVEAFSDARLLSVASALQVVTGQFLLVTLGAVILSWVWDPEPTFTSLLLTLPVLVLSAVLMVFGASLSALLDRAADLAPRVLKRRGPRLLASVLVLGPAYAFLGFILHILGLTSPVVGRPSIWPLIWVMLLTSWVLARLCVYRGRRLMEFMADEAAVNSLALEGDVTEARQAMARSLSRTRYALEASDLPMSEAPAFAVAHASHELTLSVDSFVSSALAKVERTSSRATKVQLRGLPEFVERALHGAGAIVAATAARLRALIAPMFRSHPALQQRIVVVNDPDQQVLQDPTLPLIYVTIPLVVLPCVAGAIGGATGSTGVAVLIEQIPLFGFLLLFYLVARRPGGRVLMPPPQAMKRSLGSQVAAWWAAQPGHIDPLDDGSDEIDESTPVASNFAMTIARIGLAFAVATIVALWLLWLVGVGSGEHTQVRLLAGFPVNLPPLEPAGAAYVAVACFFSLFLIFRFFGLASWHHYAGVRRLWKAWHHFVNVFVAFVLMAIVAGLVWLLMDTLAWAGMIHFDPLRGGGLVDWIRGWFAKDELFLDTAWFFATMTLLFSICYAFVIYTHPSLPRTTTCPVGHETPVRWTNVLRIPDSDGGPRNWGAVRCATCGRVPQAPAQLRCDTDSETPGLRRSSSGIYYFAFLAIAAVAVKPLGLVAASIVPVSELDLCRDLRELAELPPEAKASAFADCRDDRPTAISPTPDADWKVLVEVGDDTEWDDIPQVGETDLVLAGFFSAVGDEWSCADRLGQARNRVAHAQACAQIPPEEPPDPVECHWELMDGSVERSCACLWAETEGRADRATRTRAAQRLYRTVHVVLHEGKAACTGGRAPADGPSSWMAWHRYTEDEFAPRLLAATATGEVPSAFLLPPGPPAQEPLDGVWVDNHSHCDLVGQAADFVKPFGGEKAFGRSDETNEKLWEQADVVSDWLKSDPPIWQWEVGCDDEAEEWRNSSCDDDPRGKYCRKVADLHEYCSRKHDDFYKCLSKSGLERIVLETDTLVAIHEAANQESRWRAADERERLGIVDYAQVVPTVQGLLELVDSSSNLDRAMQVLAPPAPDSAECQASAQEWEWAQEVEQLPDDWLTQATVPSWMNKVLISDACWVATHGLYSRYGKSELKSDEALVYRWFAALACHARSDQAEGYELNDEELVTACKELRRHSPGRQMDSSKGARVCRHHGIETPEECLELLGLPESCAVENVAAWQNQVTQSLLDAPLAMRAHRESYPTVGEARSVLVQRLRAWRACSGPVTGEPHTIVGRKAWCTSHTQVAIAATSEGKGWSEPTSVDLALASYLELVGQPLRDRVDKLDEELRDSARHYIQGHRNDRERCVPDFDIDRYVYMRELRRVQMRAFLAAVEPLGILEKEVPEDAKEYFKWCREGKLDEVDVAGCWDRLSPVLVGMMDDAGLLSCVSYGKDARELGLDLLSVSEEDLSCFPLEWAEAYSDNGVVHVADWCDSSSFETFLAAAETSVPPRLQSCDWVSYFSEKTSSEAAEQGGGNASKEEDEASAPVKGAHELARGVSVTDQWELLVQLSDLEAFWTKRENELPEYLRDTFEHLDELHREDD